MKQLKFSRLLSAILVCVAVLLCMQWYWLVNLGHWQRVEFNKSINLSLEKTLSEERRLRTDSISKSIYRWMMDTSLTTITSKTNPFYKKTIYYISDKAGTVKQNSSFSLSWENRPVSTQNDSARKVIVDYLVNKFRESYSEYQAVFFHTQTIGDSASLLSETMRSDTLRIRRIFIKNLLQQNITSTFLLHFVKSSDSITANKINENANSFTSLQTKLYKSDVYKNGEIMYTYAMFKKPPQWLSGKLFVPLLLSFLLVAGVSGLLLYFYKIIRKQKELASIKNDFIDNMTHELKTPIAVISAAAEAMQQFGVLNDEAKTQKYITNIRSHSAQLHTIVNKVLDISSFEKQEISLTKTIINLKPLILEITKEHLLIRTDDKIVVDIQSQTDELFGDRFHFKNIFFNLIDNALKYNDKSNTHIIITMKEAGENIFISVQDNCKGIEPKYLENIFDKFFRVPHGNIHKVKGFGLGLFYAKKIINLHGGNINVESISGVKTTFTIVLPKNSNN
jgi:two-component system, OmpR family, phosphate regulon sensor histidine kinase PhoR